MRQQITTLQYVIWGVTIALKFSLLSLLLKRGMRRIRPAFVIWVAWNAVSNAFQFSQSFLPHQTYYFFLYYTLNFIEAGTIIAALLEVIDELTGMIDNEHVNIPARLAATLMICSAVVTIAFFHRGGPTIYPGFNMFIAVDVATASVVVVVSFAALLFGWIFGAAWDHCTKAITIGLVIIQLCGALAAKLYGGHASPYKSIGQIGYIAVASVWLYVFSSRDSACSDCSTCTQT